MPDYRTGTYIKSGAVVYIGNDGKIYPAIPVRRTFLVRVADFLRKIMGRPTPRNRIPIGIAMSAGRKGESIVVQVSNREYGYREKQ